MTPAARYQAAIEVLEQILDGSPAEKALTSWARSSRYAGSKDRAAVRDHVFDVLRQKRSLAVRGGAMNARGLIIGLLREKGLDVDAVFSGQSYAPEPLSEAEKAAGSTPTRADLFDLPDWLLEQFESSLGADAFTAATALRARAEVFLRVNISQTTREKAQASLENDGIVTSPHADCPSALLVHEGARRIAQSAAYAQGLIELQDASSQAIVNALPVQKAHKILDYCAGGGGKSLALAAMAPRAEIYAYDVSISRMRDIAPRAKRAGAKIQVLESPKDNAPYDLVLCDAPCSGAGTWRRAPQAKWDLTPQILSELCKTQAQILQDAATLVQSGGYLAYATCSILAEENESQLETFLLRNANFKLIVEKKFLPNQQGDGFFLGVLQKT